MREMKPGLSARASASIRPTAASMPARVSMSMPPPGPEDWVAHRCHHSRHAGVTKRFGARRRAAVMRAGFERDVHRRTACRYTRGFQCVDFGVRGAGPLVPAFADDSAILDDDASDTRVGAGGEQTARGELQRASHMGVIGDGKAALKSIYSNRSSTPCGCVRSRSCSISRKSSDPGSSCRPRRSGYRHLVELLQFVHHQLANLARGHSRARASAGVGEYARLPHRPVRSEPAACEARVGSLRAVWFLKSPRACHST